MHEHESNDDMITKFTKITNDLSSLGDAIDNDQKVLKVISALPPSWKVKATTLKELNTKKRWSSLVLSAKTHKMPRKAREETTPQKKKTITFKSTPTISDDEEEEEEDDLSILVRNLRRMYNKANINNRRRWQGKEEKKIICFNYRKPEHIITDV